jgi:hypothetical protein
MTSDLLDQNKTIKDSLQRVRDEVEQLKAFLEIRKLKRLQAAQCEGEYKPIPVRTGSTLLDSLY